MERDPRCARTLHRWMGLVSPPSTAYACTSAAVNTRSICMTAAAAKEGLQTPDPRGVWVGVCVWCIAAPKAPAECHRPSLTSV